MKSRRAMLCFFPVVVLFLTVRLTGLGDDILNSDGARWYRRSERFMQAITSADLAGTYQHYQPGVTLMWINAVTRGIVWQIQDVVHVPRWSLENSADFLRIHQLSKTVLIGVLTCVFVYQLAFLSKISTTKTSLIYGFLLAVEPYVIGLDRWFHLTSLEVYFAFSAFLTYLYTRKHPDGRLWFFTGVLIGISFLTKVTGVLVFVPIISLELYTVLRRGKLRRILITAGWLVAGFLVTALALFPALWVDSATVASSLFQAIGSAVETTNQAQLPPVLSFAYYIMILSFKVLPLTLIGAVAGLSLWTKQGLVGRPNRIVSASLIYFFIFFAALTLSAKKIDRYALELIPPLLLLVAVYLAKLRPKPLVVVLTLQLITAAWVYLQYFPVLSAYYSPIFGGAYQALRLGVFDNSGEYFAQAAFYLNNLEGGDVFVPDNIESFNYFYSGRTVRDFNSAVTYVVTSVDTERHAPRLDWCNLPVRSFGPRTSIPYVYILKCAGS